MALADPYCSVVLYRNALNKTDTGDDPTILADLLAVSRYLDRRLGRFFTKDAGVQTRVYSTPGSLRAPGGAGPGGWAESENPWKYGGYQRVLEVDDVASTAGLVVVADADRDGLFSDTPLAATDYELWPRNAARGPEPAPYTTIVLMPSSSQWGFQVGMRVQVTAIWGWPQIPAAIERATAQLTGILRLESPRATSRVNELGEVVNTSPEARKIVQELVRVYVKTSTIL